MSSRVRFLVGTVLLLPSAAFGQALTVQQPVVDTFSVGTSVVVPDRGAMYLGGVGRAAERSSVAGFPWRRGAYARSASASSVSAGVFVHDFEAMDAGVLGAASDAAPRLGVTKGRYDDATSYAMSRRWSRLASGGRPAPEQSARPETPAARRSPAHDPVRLLALGEAAEREGKPQLAALHYRLAAKHGSTEAARRLAAVGRGTAVADGDGP